MQLDYTDAQKAWEISQELLEKSIEYSNARMDYANAKFSYDIFLAKYLPILREKKSNLGIETAQIMILELGITEINDVYHMLIHKENYYKGLERIIDALKSQITLTQSLIKNQIQNT